MWHLLQVWALTRLQKKSFTSLENIIIHESPFAAESSKKAIEG